MTMFEPIDVQLEAQYDRVAEDYEAARYRSTAGLLLHELERRVVLAWAKGGPDSCGLDTPCGTGRLMGDLARCCSSVVGCDISVAMLQQAREGEPAQATSGVSLVRANNRRLPFDDHTFDTVLCVNFLQLTPREQWPAFLAEFHRLLKPDGTLLVEFKAPKKLAPLWRVLRRSSPPGRGPAPAVCFRLGDGPSLFHGFRRCRSIGLLFPLLPRLNRLVGQRAVLALHLALGRLPIVRLLGASLLFELRREP